MILLEIKRNAERNKHPLCAFRSAPFLEGANGTTWAEQWKSQFIEFPATVKVVEAMPRYAQIMGAYLAKDKPKLAYTKQVGDSIRPLWLNVLFWESKMVEAPKIETVNEGAPPPTLPTFFCDGIANLAPSAHVMKFYLYRSDPDQAGKPIYTNQILAQVVMPISAFIFATFFFDKSLKLLVQQGAISSDMVDKIEQIVQGEQQT